MSLPRVVLPDSVKELLESTERAWSVEQGRKHNKLYVDGRLIAVMHRTNTQRDQSGHRERNLLARVKRALA